MQLDASNRLILTGTAASNPPQLVLDPNGSVSLGGSNLLTQSAADSRYVSSANFKVGSVTNGTNVYPTVALTGGTATGLSSFAGIHATASGPCSTASGPWSTASGECSTASGYLSTASGLWSFASGLGSFASGDESTASGGASIASGYGSTASGISSTASGDSSTASGVASTASGLGSFASGFLSTASGDYATSAGVFTTAAGFGQFIIGQCNIAQGNPNVWVPADDLFVIGNGTQSVDPWSAVPLYDDNGNPLPDVQSNAFVVKKNGDTTVYGSFTVSGTSSGVNLVANGGLVVSGTLDSATNTIVASGSNQLVLIPQQGDLDMGGFTNGAQPIPPDSGQTAQQNTPNIALRSGAGMQTATHASSNTVDLAARKQVLMDRMNALKIRLQNNASGTTGTLTSGTNVVH